MRQTTIIALLIALFANETVFDLVLFAWSALSAVFAPILILAQTSGFVEANRSASVFPPVFKEI